MLRRPMFGPDGPTLFELLDQALCALPEGYDRLAKKFDATPFATPKALIEAALDAGPEHHERKAGIAAGPPPTCLDLCCGTGAATTALVERGYVVTGVDISPGMLREARRKHHDAVAHGQVRYQQGDVRNYRSDVTYDLVTCFGAFGHLTGPDEAALIRTIVSALRPGGSFVFITARQPRLLDPARLLAHAFNAAMHIRNALVRPKFVMLYLTFLLPEINETLRQAGLCPQVFDPLLKGAFKRLRVVRARKPIAT